MVKIHSEAFKDFFAKVQSNGYIQGYDENLFLKIDDNERDEIENIIIAAFNKGDYEMSIFLPHLKLFDGRSRLNEVLKNVQMGSYAYCEITYVLYNATNEEVYLDNLSLVLRECEDEDKRMNAVMDLLRCKKSDKLYEILKSACINDFDEDIRARCVVGMLYCKGIVDNPLRIQSLEEPWRKFKVDMYDNEKEERRYAIEKFEKSL